MDECFAVVTLNQRPEAREPGRDDVPVHVRREMGLEEDEEDGGELGVSVEGTSFEVGVEEVLGEGEEAQEGPQVALLDEGGHVAVTEGHVRAPTRHYGALRRMGGGGKGWKKE